MKLLQHEPSPVCGKSSVKKGIRAYAAAAPFVLPGLLLVLAFVIYPMFFTIRIALSEYRIVQGEITFTWKTSRTFCPAAPASGTLTGTISCTRW